VYLQGVLNHPLGGFLMNLRSINLAVFALACTGLWLGGCSGSSESHLVPDATVGECSSNADCDDGVFCNGAETCDPATQQCQPGTAEADGTECGDGMQCQSGVCVAACTQDEDCQGGDPCLGEQTCNLDTYACEGTPLDDGAACDLGEGEMGICLGQSCGASTCGDGYVDEAAGEQCEPPGEGACDAECKLSCTIDDDCDDGNACSGTATCNTDDSVCVPGEPLDDGADCGDGNVCLAGACITPECTENVDCNTAECFGGATCGESFTCEGGASLPDGTPCGDGNVCTDGTCVEPECTIDGDCDGDDVCLNGACITPECTENADCTAGSVCGGFETCNLTTYTCQEGTAAPNGTPCGDGNVCNDGECVEPECSVDGDCEGDDVCLNGACITPECTQNADCNDDNICIFNWCDVATYSCEETVLPNGTPCSGPPDFNTCQAGECI
jgi:hypothetical protein